jgi:putative ABC transport system permease protein
VIRFDSALANLIWLLLSVAVAALVVTYRGRLNAKKFLPSVYCGLLVGTLSVGLYLLYLVIPVRNGMDPRWFVPVMYLLMGHTTTMLIRGVSAYHTALKADEQQYEFLRGNGVPHLKALQPFMRRALLAVVQPTFANLKVLALTSMPLLLVGLLLGGFSPLNAFVLMLYMVTGCVSASVLTLGITIFMLDRLLFDKFGKMK